MYRDRHPDVLCGSRGQRASRTHGQIAIRRYAGNVAEALDDAGWPRPEAQFVAQVDELERGLQQVVTIRTPADHVQEQVQLAGRRPGLRTAEQRLAGHQRVPSTAGGMSDGTAQVSTITLTRTASRLAVKRCGSEPLTVVTNAS